NYLGDTQRNQRQWAAGIQSHQLALEIQEQLGKAHPAVSEFLIDKARSWNYLGLLHADMGDLKQALAFHAKGKEIQLGLVRDHPRMLEYQLALSRSHMNIGHLQMAQRDAKALTSFHEARKLLEQLTAARPESPAYVDALATSWNLIGVLLDDMNKFKDA